MNEARWYSMEAPMYYRLKISSNINMMLYLHHQWSDEAHILQSCSTNQYSKTVEYEAPTPFGYRVIVTLLPKFRILSDLNRAVRHEFIYNFDHVFNFRRIDLQDECFESLSTFFTD